MKTINNFINERFQSNGTNKDAMFLHKDGIRTSDDFTFNTGEKALLIKYTTDGYAVQLRGIVEIEKVLKNSIKIKTDDEDMTEFYHGLKFDKTGIAIVKTNSKYRGKSTTYWVIYNKELIGDIDIKELLEKGNNSWGFRFRNKEEDIKDLKKYIKEI
jgi:hypothetical protein